LFKSIIHRFYHRREYVFYKACTKTPSSKSELIEISEQDFKQDSLFQENERHTKFKERLKHRHACYGYQDKSGNITAYFWVTHSNTSVPLTFGATMNIPKETIFIWDCRTTESQQRKGLYTKGLKELINKHPNNKVIINCETKNLPSIKGIEKAGFKPCGKLNATLLLRKYTWVWDAHYKRQADTNNIDITSLMN